MSGERGGGGGIGRRFHVVEGVKCIKLYTL